MLSKILSKNNQSDLKKLDFKYKIENNKLIIDLEFNLYRYDLYNKNFKFSLINECIVKTSNPINTKNTVFENDYTIDWTKKRIIIDLDNIKSYTYNWLYIDSVFKAKIEIDDKIFSNTKFIQDVNINKYNPKNLYEDTFYMNPYDTYKIFKNLFSLDYITLFKLFLMVLLWVFISYNMGIFIWLLSTWIVLKSLSKDYLQNYMKLKINDEILSDDVYKEYKLSELISWKANTNLKNTTIRIVATNTENGEKVWWKDPKWLSWLITYKTYDKEKTTFKKYINAFQIHEEIIDFIPKWKDISNYLKGTIDFKKIYQNLNPEFEIGETHWLSIEWRIQILNSDFVNQEYIWTNKIINNKYFE